MRASHVLTPCLPYFTLAFLSFYRSLNTHCELLECRSGIAIRSLAERFWLKDGSEGKSDNGAISMMAIKPRSQGGRGGT